jgi:hypothetical protein
MFTEDSSNRARFLQDRQHISVHGVTEFLDFIHCLVFYTPPVSEVALSNRFSGVGVSLLGMGTGPLSETLCSVGYWAMVKVQKSSNAEYYSPSSEQFRIII